MFHIFSDQQVTGFVREAQRLLRPGGILAIVNIKKEEPPFGPPMELRVSPMELRRKLPFTPLTLIDVARFFYMQLFVI